MNEPPSDYIDHNPYERRWSKWLWRSALLAIVIFWMMMRHHGYEWLNILLGFGTGAFAAAWALNQSGPNPLYVRASAIKPVGKTEKAQTGWRIYQFAVVLFFLFGDVYWQWGMGGLAAGILGGMAGWFSSAILSSAFGSLGSLASRRER